MELFEQIRREYEHGVETIKEVARASGTKPGTRKAVPGLKSWAKFTASLRDEDRKAGNTVNRV